MRWLGVVGGIYFAGMLLVVVVPRSILGTLLFGKGAMDRGMLLASLASAAYAAWRAPSARSVSSVGSPVRLE